MAMKLLEFLGVFEFSQKFSLSFYEFLVQHDVSLDYNALE